MSRAKPKGKKVYKKAEFQKYAYFISRTTDERDQEFGFHTDTGFAKQFHITGACLTDWKQRDDFWMEHAKHMTRFKSAESDVVSGLIRRAAHGEKIGAQDAMIYLRYVKGWNPKVDLAANVELIAGDEKDFG